MRFEQGSRVVYVGDDEYTSKNTKAKIIEIDEDPASLYNYKLKLDGGGVVWVRKDEIKEIKEEATCQEV